jgi:hypothetical protein
VDGVVTSLRTDWSEQVAPGEAERFEGYAQLLAGMQERAAAGGRRRRALHAKQLLGARARFTVLDPLPEHARLGLFAEPKSYDAWVRYSNGQGVVQSDRKGDVRGMAVKVMGVVGKKLIPGLEDAPTQDFSMIHVASMAFRDADEFMSFLVAARSPALLVPRLIGAFGLGRTIALLKTLAGSVLKPVPALASQRFYTPVPIRFGAYAAKYSVVPVNPPAPAPTKSADYLGNDFAAVLAKGELNYDFRLQFYCDPQLTPIEDASIEWTEKVAPPVTVARMTLLKQDVRSDAGKSDQERVEQLSFDPWHALEAFRPIGSMMRARGPAYRVSTQGRKAAPEPNGFA